MNGVDQPGVRVGLGGVLDGSGPAAVRLGALHTETFHGFSYNKLRIFCVNNKTYFNVK